MKKLYFIFIFFLITILTSQASFSKGTINEIVNPNFLGVTLKYAEFTIGSPAKFEIKDDLNIQHNYYKFNKCTIFLGVKENKIISVGMFFSKNCDIDISNMMHNTSSKTKILASTTTLKDYSLGSNYSLGGHLYFTNDTWPNCNACFEPTFFNAMIDAAGVNGFIETKLMVNQGKSWLKYEDYIKKDQKDYYDFLSNLPIISFRSTEKCPLEKYDLEGYQLLKDEHPIGIEFGQIGSLQPKCSAKAIYNLIAK